MKEYAKYFIGQDHFFNIEQHKLIPLYDNATSQMTHIIAFNNNNH